MEYIISQDAICGIMLEGEWHNVDPGSLDINACFNRKYGIAWTDKGVIHFVKLSRKQGGDLIEGYRLIEEKTRSEVIDND